MNRYALFTDVSLNPKLKVGFGAYLVIPSSFLKIPPERIIRSEFVEQIRLRRFEVTSSTKLRSLICSINSDRIILSGGIFRNEEGMTRYAPNPSFSLGFKLTSVKRA